VTVDAVITAPAVPDVAAAAVGAAEGAGIHAAKPGGDGAKADAGDPEPAPEGDTADPASDPAPAPSRTGARQAQPATVAAPPEPEPTPVTPQPQPVAALTRLPNVELEVLSLTNLDRGNNGVPPVYRDGCLDAEASAWAGAMAGSQTMAHSGGASGAVQGCRGSGASWGDNIGYWQPCSASAMESWWMGSPSHRPHILDANFTVVGIGVWSEPSGRCWFEVYFGS
jgi:uncharacterized protein YkwD